MSSELEPIDVELRNPTVVLSVRLDEATAKQLHRLARQRGVRMSELLRQAAGLFVEGAAKTERPVGYRIEFLDTRVAVGTTAVESQGSKTEESGRTAANRSPWGERAQLTGLSSLPVTG